MRKVEFKISDEELVKTYNETHSLVKTALIAQGIKSTATVAKKLRALGVEVKRHNLKPIKVSDKELIDMYNKGKSLIEIAKISSGSKGAMQVRKRLNELGVSTRYRDNINKYKEKMSMNFHQYSIDEKVFDAINSEEKAYWLGLLMADGYNNTDKYAVTLRLQAEDREILEKFKVFLKTDAPIYSFEKITKVNNIKREYLEVRANSVHLSKQLDSLGCKKGKTYTLQFPNYIPDKLMNHFIRGYFDGDGCLCVLKRRDRISESSMTYQFTIAGKAEFLEKIKECIVKNTGVNDLPLKVMPNNFAQTIHYGGRNVVNKIMSYLYKNATIFLKRKHDKYINQVVRHSNMQ